jgi:hypothetical protein
LVELINKDLNLEEEVKELQNVFKQDEFNDWPNNLIFGRQSLFKMSEIFVCMITNSLILGVRIFDFIKNLNHVSKILRKTSLKN